jgi:hypothetical protein
MSVGSNLVAASSKHIQKKPKNRTDEGLSTIDADYAESAVAAIHVEQTFRDARGVGGR